MLADDEYGYDAIRASMAHRLGVSAGYVASTYTDEWIYQNLAANEQQGRPITWDSLDIDNWRCSECHGASHLSEPELSTLAAAMNSVYYLTSYGTALRAGVSRRDRSKVDASIDAMGRIARDRCVLSQARAALVGVTS